MLNAVSDMAMHDVKPEGLVDIRLGASKAVCVFEREGERESV